MEQSWSSIAAQRHARLERAEEAIHEVLDVTAATAEELSKLHEMDVARMESLGKDFLRLTEAPQWTRSSIV
eukprot:scaffold463_cov242-Pinguiococcus_pyrenoidosus.AAC.11